MGEPSMIDTGVLKRNPFPGIRPYTSAEDKYFFGRESTVKEVLNSLLINRFIALVGASGSGKTSLIQSGIIPALLTDEKQEWVPVIIRPGNRPVESLIRGFQQVFPKKLKETDVQSFLAGSQSLGELIIEKGLGSHNYYLVVDQFEELFQRGPSQKKNGKKPEVSRFVDLLVKAAKNERPGIYVMLSIRSDYIDACSNNRSLTEQMNRGKYLLPQMTGESLSEVILGPIHQAGASVEDGFVDLLLEDLDEVDTQLPMLQHALMRTWDYWTLSGNRDQPISINDYKAVGTIKNALSDHLDQAYEELDEKKKMICERLFKSITSKSDKYNGFRRQASLGNLARIAQCTLEEMIDVVEVFRKPGRSFLSPQASVSLASETIVELSHEALIRIWDRLSAWVDEEYESIQMYLRLSEASALYQQGRTELWTPPELLLAQNWRDTQKPTPAWGVQYNPAFERAMVFLSTSEEEFQWEEERKVYLQRRRLFMNRAIAISMGVLVVVLTIIFIGTRNRPSKEEMPAEIIQQDYAVEPGDRQEAVSRLEELSGDQFREVTVEPDPVPSEEIAADQNEERERQAPVERIRRQPVNNTQRTSSTQQTTSSGERSNSNTQTRRETSATETNTESAELETQRQILSIAKEVAARSTEVSRNPDLQGLLAYQAYKINTRYNGRYYDVDIYNGLYTALKKLISPAYNIYPNLRSSVKAIEWLDRTGSILVASSDGSMKILSGNYANRASQINLQNTGYNNECIALSSDEKVAAVGTGGGGLLFLELENRGAIVHQNTEQGKIVLFLSNLNNSGSFLSAGTDNRILKWEYGSFESSELVATSSRPSALATSFDGTKAAFGTRDGQLFEFNITAPEEINEVKDFGGNYVGAIAFSPGGQYMVAGLLDGSLQVLAGSNRKTIAILKGPGARVTDLAYSPDGRFLAASSHDGNVYLWNTSDWSNQPVVFTENNGFVLSVCFSGNSGYFYSGSVDYPRLIGRPSEAASMVNDFCSLVGRNLTQAEWDQYFGGDIPYEETCPGTN